MKKLILLLLLMPSMSLAGTITWVNDGGDGWDDDVDTLREGDLNEIKTEVDDNDAQIDLKANLISPVLVTPDLGTPDSGNGSNITDLNGTQITTGIVDEARLDPDVLLEAEASNFFSGTAVPTQVCTEKDFYLRTSPVEVYVCSPTDVWTQI